MRSKWVVWAAKQTVGSRGARVILHALADHSDPDGNCFPSVGRLAEQTLYSVRAVQGKLKELEGLGLLKREVGGGWIAKGRGRPNRFQLVEMPVSPAHDGGSYPAETAPKSYPANSAPTENIEENGRLPRKICGGREEGLREEGGGSAHAHMHEREPARGLTPTAKPSAEDAQNGATEPRPAPKIDPDCLSQIVAAAGWAAIGRRPINDDRLQVAEWNQLGLGLSEQLEVIAEVLPTMPEPGPPQTLKYFSHAMRRRSEAKAKPPLQQLYPTEKTRKRANGHSANIDKRNQLSSIVLAAAGGTAIDLCRNLPAYVLAAARGTT